MRKVEQIITILQKIGHMAKVTWTYTAPKLVSAMQWLWQSLRQLGELWESYRNRDTGDPLYTAKLITYLWEQRVKWLYLLFSILSLIASVGFAISNPFKDVRLIYWQLVVGQGVSWTRASGSPVMAGCWFLIAVFLFNHFRALRRKARPTNDYGIEMR